MSYHPLMVRSKNAGPYTLTIDFMFAESAEAEALYQDLVQGRVVPAPGPVAGPDAEVFLDRTAAAVKITMGRSSCAGSFGDVDLYGCQEHVGALAALGLSDLVAGDDA